MTTDWRSWPEYRVRFRPPEYGCADDYQRTYVSKQCVDPTRNIYRLIISTSPDWTEGCNWEGRRD